MEFNVDKFYIRNFKFCLLKILYGKIKVREKICNRKCY